MAVKAAFILLLTTTLFVFSAAAQPPSPWPNCTNQLVAMSPCLDFISDPPNNLTANVTSRCCEAVLSVFISGEGLCLCYLFLEPLILGFPLNESRVNQLSSICEINNQTFAGSLKSSCPDLQALPPLHSSSGSDTEASRPSRPHHRGPHKGSSHSPGTHNASSSPAERSNASASAAPRNEMGSNKDSAATRQSYRSTDRSLSNADDIFFLLTIYIIIHHSGTNWSIPEAIFFFIIMHSFIQMIKLGIASVANRLDYWSALVSIGC